MAVLHSVYIYVKDEAPDDLPGKMRKDILHTLSQIKTVQQIYTGGPLGVDRDVVDNNYAMSLHAHFTDREGMMAYQKDPKHLAFVDKFKPYWDHIRVFDSEITDSLDS